MSDISNNIPQGTSLAVLGVFVCVVALLLFKSATMRTQIKRGLIFLLIIAGILVGYFFLTGKSPAEIPARIDQFLILLVLRRMAHTGITTILKNAIKINYRSVLQAALLSFGFDFLSDGSCV